jgi:hypothetical protein
MFTRLSDRAPGNMDNGYLGAFERYQRLAFKA